MAVTASSGADRARYLLNGIPDRFNDFCHMDQFTFIQLADYLLENAESVFPGTSSPSETCTDDFPIFRSSTVEEDISVEESLFVFFDIVAQGNSFRNAAYDWDHDIKLTHKYALPCRLD